MITSILYPIIVGVVLTIFKSWYDDRKK
ncbi:type I toxin-antitoxin system Fst family toxin [Fructilactobacillus frigidiflavus]